MILEQIPGIEMNGEPVYIVYNIFNIDYGPGLISERLIGMQMSSIDIGRKEGLTKKYPNALDIELIVKKLADKGVLK